MIHSVFCLPIEIYNVYSETRSNNNQSADEVTTEKKQRSLSRLFDFEAEFLLLIWLRWLRASLNVSKSS